MLIADGGSSPVESVRMRLTVSVAVIAMALAVSCVGSASAGTKKPSRVGQTWTGRVVVVADGDTLEVMRDGRAVRVRMAGIDAPESGQPWSRRARSRLAELVFHRDVTVHVRDVDRYGRDVVDVMTSDGRRVNSILVGEGLAWFYEAYSDDGELERLEIEARSGRRGVWSDRNPTPPWVWRQRHPRTAR